MMSESWTGSCFEWWVNFRFESWANFLFEWIFALKAGQIFAFERQVKMMNFYFEWWVKTERASFAFVWNGANKLTSPAWGDEFRQRLEFIAFQAGYLFLWSIQIYLEFGYFALARYHKQSFASGYFATLSMTKNKSNDKEFVILSFR